MRKALIAVAVVIAAVAVPVAVLLVYGGTGIPGEVDPVASRQDAERETHFTTDPSIHAIAVSQAAGVIQGEPAVIPDAIAAANNGFAVDFYREVAVGDGNIFFSPTSMFVAFSALYEGARGNTADQMQQVFGFEPDLQARYNDTARLMSSVNRDDPNATLEMANALWPAIWFAPYDSYVDAVHGVYLADVERVDFEDDSDDGGVWMVNTWASDKTNGRIPKVLEQNNVDADTALVITNAIYFKGTWVTQFSEDETRESDFWMSTTESVKADFMNARAKFDHAKVDGAQVLRMPYEGDRLSMLIILPDGRDGMSGLDSTVSTMQIERWKQDMRPQEIIVSVPKFTTKAHYDLMGPLSSLGVSDVFDLDMADLSGIAYVPPDQSLYVTKAIHDAYVDVSEEGTEAAAVTTIVGTLEESLSPRPQWFNANHPFIFIIQDDESGAILFMGRLSDPTA